MKENLELSLIARAVHDYYIKDRNLTYRTILKGLPEEKRKQIYDDTLYGMGNWKTLKEWLVPASVKTSSEHPKYAELAAYFGLERNQMIVLLGSNAMLKMLTKFGQGKFIEVIPRNHKG